MSALGKFNMCIITLLDNLSHTYVQFTIYFFDLVQFHIILYITYFYYFMIDYFEWVVIFLSIHVMFITNSKSQNGF